MEKIKMRRCRNFYCRKVHGHYCCADCELLRKCPRRCLNDPSRCGLSEEPSAGSKK